MLAMNCTNPHAKPFFSLSTHDTTYTVNTDHIFKFRITKCKCIMALIFELFEKTGRGHLNIQCDLIYSVGGVAGRVFLLDIFKLLLTTTVSIIHVCSK